MWIWGFFYFYCHSRWQWSREVTSRKLFRCRGNVHFWNKSTVACSDMLWLILLRCSYLRILAPNGGIIDELERIWKEAVVAWWKYLPGEAEESTKIRSQDIRCSSWDSKSAPPEYKWRAIPLHRLARWMAAAVVEVNSLDIMLSTLAVHESSRNEQTVVLFVHRFSLRYSAWNL
jgi:hypothetical protein